MTKKQKSFGVCRLTGNSGQFVDSHILPKALTRSEVAGSPFVQGGRGLAPSRRWKSWTDGNLVIRKGEDILSDLDDWGIKVLRRHRLVWSGWGNASTLPAEQMTIDGMGARFIEGINPGKLRLFFLSLLWRAAASSLMEMNEVVIPPEDLERMRSLIVTQNPGPISFYPAQLIQLSTRGVQHNHTPFGSVKIIPSFEDGVPEREIPIFRFYMDGLVIHFHRQSDDDGYAKSLGPLIVGSEGRLAVTSVPYEHSFQAINLRNAVLDTEGISRSPKQERTDLA